MTAISVYAPSIFLHLAPVGRALSECLSLISLLYILEVLDLCISYIQLSLMVINTVYAVGPKRSRYSRGQWWHKKGWVYAYVFVQIYRYFAQICAAPRLTRGTPADRFNLAFDRQVLKMQGADLFWEHGVTLLFS